MLTPADCRVLVEHLVVLQSTVQALLRASVAQSRAPVEEDVDDLHDIQGRRRLVLHIQTPCVAAVLAGAPHQFISHLFDCLAKADDELKNVP